MDFEVLKASIDMADTIGYIHATSWQQAYKDIVPDDLLNLLTPSNRAEWFIKNMPTWDTEAYLFTVQKKGAGLAFLTKSREETAAEYDGEISAIYFLSDFWGTEYTHKAMSFCIERLQELGYRSIIIWVLEANLRARKFSEKYGFSFCGEKKEIHLGKPLVEIQYRKDLL